MPLAIPDAGRVTLNKLLATFTYHLALGRGSAGWDETPVPVDDDTSALVDPLGVLRPNTVSFVVPDEGGTIFTSDGGRWSATAGGGTTPSQYLWLLYQLGFDDIDDEQIREVALYANTTFEVGVPGGQNWIDIADVTDLGDLLLIERRVVINRTPTIYSFGQIINF